MQYSDLMPPELKIRNILTITQTSLDSINSCNSLIELSMSFRTPGLVHASTSISKCGELDSLAIFDANVVFPEPEFPKIRIFLIIYIGT